MCPASPSYRIIRRRTGFSKHWRPKRQLFSNILISHFSLTIPCSPPPPRAEGRTRIHKPPELLKGCFIASATISTDRVYGTRTSQRRRLATVWIHASAGRRTLERFIAEFALVAEDVFITLVHELAEQVPL